MPKPYEKGPECFKMKRASHSTRKSDGGKKSFRIKSELRGGGETIVSDRTSNASALDNSMLQYQHSRNANDFLKSTTHRSPWSSSKLNKAGSINSKYTSSKSL